MPSEAALEAMAQRMDSTNFGFVVMAVNIQRTVGGSLAEILDMVADTVRQRQQFTRKVKALTAQGRMSAYVLLAHAVPDGPCDLRPQPGVHHDPVHIRPPARS